MSGYVASARVLASSPRLLRRGADGPWVDGTTATFDHVVVDVDRPPARLEPANGLAERLGRVRDRWTQLTFFLTDPDSWR